MSDDEAFLRSFFQALEDGALEPDNERYVPFYENDSSPNAEDPVAELETGIRWTNGGSVQLLSGFRGTGKSTELLRLRATLQAKQRYKVALCDMQRYLDLHNPIDVSGFLISAAGALSDALEDESLLGRDETREGYWKRISHFFTTTEVELAGPSLGVSGAGLKTNLKVDPSLRRRIHEALRGRLGNLVEDVRSFVGECVSGLRSKHGEDTELVVIFDSIEQFQGSHTNAHEVQASLETLFAGHADKLAIPGVHIVYTVPPWLKIRVPGINQIYTGAPLLPCIRVRNRDGSPCTKGIQTLERIVEQRGDWSKLLGHRDALRELIAYSGGYIRDLFRLLQGGLRRARGRQLPLSSEDLDFIIARARDAYLPIAHEDAQWLSRVAKSHEAELALAEDLPDLSRFFDTHRLLCYRNGDEWYDIHPLIADKVRELTSRTDVEET